MPDDLSQRRHLLTTTLVGALLPKDVPESHTGRARLDSWAGIGHVVQAMHTTRLQLRLTRSPFCWWVEFCRDRMNPASFWIGQNQDATPWTAVQRAALETLRRDWSA